jgi:hypothetical protein
MANKHAHLGHVLSYMKLRLKGLLLLEVAGTRHYHHRQSERLNTHEVLHD